MSWPGTKQYVRGMVITQLDGVRKLLKEAHEAAQLDKAMAEDRLARLTKALEILKSAQADLGVAELPIAEFNKVMRKLSQLSAEEMTDEE